MNDTEALKNYVRAEDGALQWTLRGTSQHVYATIYEFALTSQIWQGRAWTHRLQLFVPHTPHATKPNADMPMVVNSAADAVLLYITTQGGSAETELGVQACAATGIACAFLYDVPNQPLFEGLMEDALIAHTFVRYLETGDATWPLLFPMVKSVVRAMDALQAFSREASNAKTVPHAAAAEGQSASLVPFARFLITGASKRGWTSWLTAVAEAETGRVAAIAPMVYDNLNLLAQMPHQREVMGGYSASIHDYTELDLQARMATPEGAQLARMVDPYTYLDRLTLPKLLINGANDLYWMTDALNLYWPALPTPKHVLYVPNTGHFLGDTARVYATLVAFVRAVVAHDALPAPVLNVTETESFVTINAGNITDDVRLWVAYSTSRDFRGAFWKSPTHTPCGKEEVWTTTVRKPSDGFMALFGEFGFVYDGLPYTLSTPVNIFPMQLKMREIAEESAGQHANIPAKE